MRNFDTNEVEMIFLFSALGLIALALLLQWWRYARLSIITRYAKTNTHDPKSKLPPVSVVIATRNENTELLESLPFFLSQDYPEYELVLVVDDSDQDLLYQLREYEQKHPQLKVVRFVWTRNFFLARKFAEAIGIKSAKYDHHLISTATSRPHTERWIRAMIEGVEAPHELWMGFYKSVHKHSLTSQFIAYDDFLQAQNAFASALRGKPYTADIHNFGFKKPAYFAVSGVAEYYNVDTGNDAMLVSKMANNHNVRVCIGPDATMRSVTETHLSQWLHAKRRHLLMMPAFPLSVRFCRRTLNFIKLLSLLLQIILLVSFANAQITVYGFELPVWTLIIAAFVLKWAVILPITYQNMRAIGAKVNLCLMPFFDALSVLLYPAFFITYLFSKRVTWNSNQN